MIMDITSIYLVYLYFIICYHNIKVSGFKMLFYPTFPIYYPLLCIVLVRLRQILPSPIFFKSILYYHRRQYFVEISVVRDSCCDLICLDYKPFRIEWLHDKHRTMYLGIYCPNMFYC